MITLPLWVWIPVCGALGGVSSLALTYRRMYHLQRRISAIYAIENRRLKRWLHPDPSRSEAGVGRVRTP